MHRCLQCEATMTSKEKRCPNCGASARRKSDRKTARHRFRFVVNLFFLASAVLTLVALFTDYGPPFVTCLAVTLVLLLVKSSADEMLVDLEK